MKFIAETDGSKHDVEIVREEGRVTASVDGRKYELEASEPESGVFLLKKDGAVYEALVSSQANPGDPDLVRVRDEVHEVRIIDRKRLILS